MLFSLFKYSKYQLYPIMANLSDFKRGKIVGARMEGTSITKTIQIFSISRGTVLKVMIASEKEKKCLSKA